MLKRTKGYLLLVLLVITGLAGTINTNTLTQDERKKALTQLKFSKDILLNNLQGLSKKQVHFKSAAHEWSISDCIYRLALDEARLWKQFEMGLKEPGIAGFGTGVKKSVEEELSIIDGQGPPEMEKSPWPSPAEALTSFKSKRNEQIKYVKSTTEEFHNHFVKFPAGSIDCYEMILFISVNTERLSQQIDAIMAEPGFPRK